MKIIAWTALRHLAVVTSWLAFSIAGTVSAGTWQVNTGSNGTYFNQSFNQSGGTLTVGGVVSIMPGQLAVQYSQPLAGVGTYIIDYNWLSSTDYKARVGIGLYDATGNIVLPGQITPTSEGEYIKVIASNISGGGGLNLGPGVGIDGGGPGGAYQIAPYYFNGPTSGALMLQRNGNEFQGSYFQRYVAYIVHRQPRLRRGGPLPVDFRQQFR